MRYRKISKRRRRINPQSIYYNEGLDGPKHWPWKEALVRLVLANIAFLAVVSWVLITGAVLFVAQRPLDGFWNMLRNLRGILIITEASTILVLAFNPRGVPIAELKALAWRLSPPGALIWMARAMACFAASLPWSAFKRCCIVLLFFMGFLNWLLVPALIGHWFPQLQPSTDPVVVIATLTVMFTGAVVAFFAAMDEDERIIWKLQNLSFLVPPILVADIAMNVVILPVLKKRFGISGFPNWLY